MAVSVSLPLAGLPADLPTARSQFLWAPHRSEYKTFLKLFLEKTSLNNLYAFDDPKIAFGYINMGTLRYTNKEEITKILKNAHFIKDWKIIGRHLPTLVLY